MHHQASCIVLLPFTDGMDMDVLLDYMTCSFAFYQCWQTFSVIVISQMGGSAKLMHNSFKIKGIQMISYWLLFLVFVQNQCCQHALSSTGENCLLL